MDGAQHGIIDLPATELARRIADGRLSAVDVVEAHIARIEAVNPALNAVVVRRYEEARAEARHADERRACGEPLGPLHGVPVTIKESIDLAGTAATFGITSRASHRATADELHVARLRAAGAIVLAKTNVSQLLIYTEADNPLHGRTANPWNPLRSCGGSSGGEGAIIAAGGSPLGLGTDIGGSVRVPAAFCGIASLKPTSGRLPDPGRCSVPVGQQAIPSQIGVLAREVEDVALGLEIANGGRQPVGEPHVALGDYLQVDVRRLRVGYYTGDDTFATSPAIRRAVTTAVGLLRDAGAQVIEWQPPDTRRALQLFGGILTADGGAGLRQALAGSRRSPQVAQLLAVAALPGSLIHALRGLLGLVGQRGLQRNLEMFGGHHARDYWALVEAQIDYRQQFAAALDHSAIGAIDVLVAPATSLPAVTHGATRDLLTAGDYATLYNLLGYPAGVVPVTRVRVGEESDRPASRDLVQRLARQVEQGSAGLPVGVQVIARPWQEHQALAAMHAIQQAARQQADYPVTPVDPQG